MTNVNPIQVHNDSAFVAYSLPGETHFYSCVVNKIYKNSDKIGVIDADFVFAPFDKKAHPRYLFQFANVEENNPFEIEAQSGSEEQETTWNYYEANCKDAINRIKSGELSKLVLSKVKIEGHQNESIWNLYSRLQKAYPQAFVYLVKVPNEGIWMGASPELLLSKNNAQFKTVALAGTQKLDKDISQIKWAEKEIEEQDIIVRFVEASLKEKNIHYIKSESYTSAAANVCHIKTDFMFPPDMELEKTIEAIHPGPAIAGMPKNTSVDIVNILENYDREYYCGYLGPIHKNGNFDFFINLRCMQVFTDYFKLYVGGGITKDSVPEDEWEETELKAMTLLSVLQNDVPQ